MTPRRPANGTGGGTKAAPGVEDQSARSMYLT